MMKYIKELKMKIEYKSDLGGMMVSLIFFLIGSIFWARLYLITGEIFNWDATFFLMFMFTIMGAIGLIMPIRIKRNKKRGKKK